MSEPEHSELESDAPEAYLPEPDERKQARGAPRAGDAGAHSETEDAPLEAEIVLEPNSIEPAEDEEPAPAAKTTTLPAVRSETEYGPVTALTRYMAELRHHAPISREEEHALAVRWVEEGDVDAAHQLMLANLRLVVKIAMEYRRAWTNTLDLIQEGNVGLLEAVQRFDPYMDVKLSSYAVYWIRAYILKYILDNMRSVRMGTTRAQRKLFFRLNKEKRELERQGYEVEPKLLAERLDVTEDDVIDMETRLSHPDMSMDAPARRDEAGGATFGDRIAGVGASAETVVGDEELRRVFQSKVEDFAQTLSDRDQIILRERLLADPPQTLAQLGVTFGVSRERVRQLEARLLKQLRAHVEREMVDFEMYTPPASEKSERKG